MRGGARSVQSDRSLKNDMQQGLGPGVEVGSSEGTRGEAEQGGGVSRGGEC